MSEDKFSRFFCQVYLIENFRDLGSCTLLSSINVLITSLGFNFSSQILSRALMILKHFMAPFHVASRFLCKDLFFLNLQ